MTYFFINLDYIFIDFQQFTSAASTKDLFCKRNFTFFVFVIFLVDLCIFYENDSNYKELKKEQSCPFQNLIQHLPLFQKLIDVDLGINHKNKNIQNPLKNRIYPSSLKIPKIRYQSTSNFFIQYHLFEEVKRKTKTRFILKKSSNIVSK